MSTSKHSIETAGKYGPGRVRGLRFNPQLDAYEKHAFSQIEAEYREDLLESMKEMETRTLPNAPMIDMQPELEWFMRPFLLDFLVDTHLTLKLDATTLFLAVNIVDRYCSKRVVAKKHYQLVGCTALWIASKYEDKKSHVPSISELINMCCGVYEEAMFLQMEGHILNTLEWSIGHTTLDAFISLIVGSSCNPTIIHTARFLAECSMYHRSFFTFNPSLISKCCVQLAHYILGYTSTPSSSSLLAAFSADPTEQECLSLLAHHIQSPTQSLQNKYMKPQYSQVTKLVANHIVQKQAPPIVLPPSPAPSDEYVPCSPNDLQQQHKHGQQQQQQQYQQKDSFRTHKYATPPQTPGSKVSVW